jgi:iron(III) transport system ATP-binding protein
MTTVTTRGLAMSFAGRPVLHALDLHVPHRSVTAVLGPSGCGKTTLLRIIAGFLEPDRGVVVLGERTVVGSGRPVAPQQRRVGYVPQEGALFPHLTVADNITFGLSRADRRGNRLAEMLDLVELSHGAAARYPHQLSGGQQQRVALARALAPKPDVVLLDEPFSSLDATLRAETGREVVRALHAAGATAILVTHDQGEALSLADQVAVMRDGQLAQVGSPTDLYHSPVDADVATFVGGAVLIPATVRDGTATCVLGDIAVEAGRPHGAASLLIRPEQLQLLPHTAKGVAARVAEVSFYGHDASVQLVLAASGERVVARVFGRDVPTAGTDVRVSVHGPVTVFAGDRTRQ